MKPQIMLRKVLFDFGKYEGMSVEYVADHDPGYINWAMEHTQDKLWGKYAQKKVKEWKENRQYQNRFPNGYPDLEDPMADDIFDGAFSHHESPGFGV